VRLWWFIAITLLLVSKDFKKRSITPDNVYSLIPWVIISGIVFGGQVTSKLILPSRIFHTMDGPVFGEQIT